uniref:NADH-ubiquinone oxidoreductase chain 6 n=1 Tax=Champsodon cf. snyderi CBM-ZF 10876 TaxID=270612 RepID=T2HVQ0_9TELE|nr:NADH dehydrogenase subunit 6 [Champsodon cf. snyderi CBM-ZF 10876]BAN83373.1 NADH dehydrogenase subunit 6 [Champsodon cf. snyderi CBM-ZF 10876]
MAVFTYLLLFGFVFGVVLTVSNPAPHLAAFGLVFSACVGCVVLMYYGSSFLCLILFLIYLGGMLVVFAYCVSLAADPYPEGWGNLSVTANIIVYMLGLVFVGLWYYGECFGGSWVPIYEREMCAVISPDPVGVSVLYDSGGGMMVLGAWALLTTLFVVFQLSRGGWQGALRAV